MKGKKAPSVVDYTKIFVRAVSGGMSFVLGGHVWRDCSGDGGPAFNIYVWTIAQIASESVQTFEELPHSLLIVRALFIIFRQRTFIAT